MTERPSNIHTVAEAQALVDAAELLNAAFPRLRLSAAVSAAREALDTARDFGKRGSIPVTVGSEIRYTDSQGRLGVGRVAKIGRKWIELDGFVRFEIATGHGLHGRVSPTDQWRLSRLIAKETT